jgi:hypothetical protein
LFTEAKVCLRINQDVIILKIYPRIMPIMGAKAMNIKVLYQPLTIITETGMGDGGTGIAADQRM